MKLNQTILICIAICAVSSAQTATQLFNPAAKEYIYGNTPVASNLVEQALSKFPEDDKLLKLKKLIDEQQKQKDNQDQQQQQNQDQQKQDQQKKNEQDKQKDQQQQEQEKQPDQSKSGQNKEQEQKQAAQPKQAGEMNKEEAQQLLDAMKQNEQDQRANLTPFLGGPVRVEKDW